MYFESKGKVNTEETLELARKRGESLGINEIVVSSTTGFTAKKALEICKGFRITAVSHHCGSRKPFAHMMEEDTRRDLEERGVRVVVAGHALSGVERAVARKHGGVYPALLMADTLRLFGQGTKVAVEVCLMAADAGMLTGADVIAVGGSSHGADTALVIKPAHAADMFEMRIREVICKPRVF